MTELKTKLNSGQKNMLRLIVKGRACSEGWAPCSALVYPLLKAMPEELIELQPVGNEGRGRARLTPTGQNVFVAMEWL